MISPEKADLSLFDTMKNRLNDQSLNVLEKDLEIMCQVHKKRRKMSFLSSTI